MIFQYQINFIVCSEISFSFSINLCFLFITGLYLQITSFHNNKHKNIMQQSSYRFIELTFHLKENSTSVCSYFTKVARSETPRVNDKAIYILRWGNKYSGISDYTCEKTQGRGGLQFIFFGEGVLDKTLIFQFRLYVQRRVNCIKAKWRSTKFNFFHLMLLSARYFTEN